MWQKSVDLHGINHNNNNNNNESDANYFSDLHDKFLDSRKNGFYLTSTQSTISLKDFTHKDFIRLNEVNHFPHYLSKSFHETYHSTSILGRLFDCICHSVDDIIQINETVSVEESDLLIDSSFRIDYNLCCDCFTADFVHPHHHHHQEFTQQQPMSQSQSQSQHDEVKSLYLQTAREFFQRFTNELSQLNSTQFSSKTAEQSFETTDENDQNNQSRIQYIHQRNEIILR